MVYNLLLVLKPKTKIEDFNDNSSPITNNSKLHFQSIAKKSYRDFQTESKLQSESAYLDDLCTQLYCNSRICDDKFENYKKGLDYFTKTLICCLGEIVIYFSVNIMKKKDFMASIDKVINDWNSTSKLLLIHII